MGSKGRDYGLVKAKHFFIPSLLYMKKSSLNITSPVLIKKFWWSSKKKIREWQKEADSKIFDLGGKTHSTNNSNGYFQSSDKSNYFSFKVSVWK